MTKNVQNALKAWRKADAAEKAYDKAFGQYNQQVEKLSSVEKKELFSAVSRISPNFKKRSYEKK